MNKNKTGIFLIVFLLFTMLGADTGSYSNILVLKARAVVSDDIVRMKDIALMDAPTRTRIGSLVIAVSPELGNTTRIQKKEIYEKLIGNGVSSPQIKGAASVTVLRKGMVVKPSFFKEKIHQYIVTHSRWKNGVELEIITSKAIVIPESGIRWHLTPANGQDFFGNILFKVKAISNATNEEIYSNWIVVKIKINKPVAVSNRTIQKNEMIREGDIRWENREITAFNKDAILNKREIIGQKAGRIIYRQCQESPGGYFIDYPFKSSGWECLCRSPGAVIYRWL
jgi:hypothetical protein